MSSKPLQLWSDEPSSVDLLAFGAVAETAVEAVLDDRLENRAGVRLQALSRHHSPERRCRQGDRWLPAPPVLPYSSGPL